MEPINGTLLITNERQGDWAKIFAMITLGLGSFLAGMLPAIICDRSRRRFPLTTSLLLCFGAGILLATALVHILPEVRRQMSSNFAEIAFSVGFFIVYFIDEFIHYAFGEAIQHTHSSTMNMHYEYGANQHNNYGSTETAPLLKTADATDNGHTQIHASKHQDAHCDDATIAAANARICHTTHQEPCLQTMSGTLGLFIALSLHATIEGLAIGVQESSTKVIFLLGAVSCHKFVMGFCLGLEFRQTSSLRTHFFGILVFSLGATLGIGAGMLIVDMTVINWTVLPLVQSLAGGTLLYVTVCEVLPREKTRWHLVRKVAGLAQFFAVASGFAAISLIDIYFEDAGT